jgi:alpha-tubulin suppressor-like RCC1 family protein
MWGGGGSEQIVLKSDGMVWTWGLNSSGELGNGTTNNSAVPIQVVALGGVGYLASIKAIMGGELHNFALKTDGTVWAWGMNFFGQLGDGSTNWGAISNRSTTPVQVFGLTSVKSLGGRGYHSLALKTDGTIWCWGDNASGQLGNGVAFNGTNTPVQVIGLTNPAVISGGGFFSLALMPDGTLRSWGDNSHGQLGDGTTSNRYTPVLVIGLSNVTQISGGWFHAIALKSDGTAWSWGENLHGEIGDGTTVRRMTPVQVAGLSNVVSVWGGDNNSMALTSDGTVWKWGENQFGELGDGTVDDGSIAHPLPQQVPGLTNVAFAVCRDYHNICIKGDGTVWVWGDNRYGGCGDLTGNSVLRPRVMPGLVSNNTIPYAESFESYASGFSVVGTNFWYSDNSPAAVVTATNYTSSYSGSYPIAGTHQSSLQIDGAVTNRFCPNFYTNVFVDMILQMNAPTNPVLPSANLMTNTAFALSVTPNRHLAVWNCTNAPAAGNGWTELQDVDVSSNQFCRITIKADYLPDTNGMLYYSVWVNGVPSTNPRARYAAADSSQPWFGEIVASGRFLLDDLVLTSNKTFYAVQALSAGYGGAISPSGAQIVAPGGTNTFTITASNWYHLASVVVDGVNMGTPASYTFANVSADHTIVANFAADLAANNTPKWWLYQMNTNWSANFDAAALGDQDGDGVPTWQEYIAGTDPQDQASRFLLGASQSNGQPMISFSTVPTSAQYGLQRYYALESCTNLALPVWRGVSGLTNVLGLGQTVICTNPIAGPNVFLRGRVWLWP